MVLHDGVVDHVVVSGVRVVDDLLLLFGGERREEGREGGVGEPFFWVSGYCWGGG